MSKYRCTVCNWIYDEEKELKLFLNLDESFSCPICGAEKSAFVKEKFHGEKYVKTTVADKIVEQLEKFGVKYIYGIPGDSNLPLIEAIRKSNIKFILTRHEETAAFMASAHGKMTDNLGVCISIAGPGSTNLITGLVDAATDRSPVLALTGQVPEIYLGSEAFQEINQIEIFKPFSEYAETVSRPNQALRVAMHAVNYAYRKPGISVLATPTDVLTDHLSANVYEPEKKLFKNLIVSRDEDIIRAAELINNSNKVSMLVGWGGRHSGDTILKISERIKCPIATTSRAKGIINETSNYSIGVLGSIGPKYTAKVIRESEVLLIVGSGFRQSNLIPKNIKIIQIDIDTSRMGKTFNVDVGLVGDSELILNKLLEYLTEKEGNIDYLKKINEFKKQYLTEIDSEANDYSIPINPGFLVQAIKRNVSNDAIICVDVGDHTYWFYKKFICEGQKTYLSANMASMGFAVPAALSAKLDFPEKQVLCISGDGGFSMLMADFTTAVHENLNVTFVIFNDGKLKNITKEQVLSSYPEFGVKFENPNFSEFAKSAGGIGFRVYDPKELDAVLKEAFNSKKPAIVEVMTDPEKLAYATKSIE